MNIRIAQINPIVGDIDGNSELIRKTIISSPDDSIVVFPELAITGYPPQDLLLDPKFINQAQDAIQSLKTSVQRKVAIIGLPRYDEENLYNSAAIINNQKILGYHDKVLLPTYDVFDEKRYFKSSNTIQPYEISLDGKVIKIGVQICEDLWDQNYDLSVSDELIQKGAEMMINISASPYRKSIIDKRIKLCRDRALHLKYYFIYCNMVGAQDELVFDGRSFIINADGKNKLLAQMFKQEILDFNFNQASNNKDFQISSNSSEEIFEALRTGVRDYFRKTNFRKAVIGLSGGIDSALTATLVSEAIGPENVHGISMPSQFSSEHSKDDAYLLADNLGINFETISINNIFNEFLNHMDVFFKDTQVGLAEENLQARIRGNILMSIANKINGLVLNTGNKTELALGYCTMYGDMCGALGVISDLNKIEVYDLAKWINSSKGKTIIPQNSIDKAPSAELRENQYDPFDYEIIAPLVDLIINDNMGKQELIDIGYNGQIIDDVLNKIYLSEYKRRQAPPGIKISNKAFGIGRRYPIVNKYKGS